MLLVLCVSLVTGLPQYQPHTFGLIDAERHSDFVEMSKLIGCL